MKKILVGIAALIVATPLVTAAQTQRPSDRSDAEKRDTRPAWRAEGNVIEARQLVGTRIKNAEGKDIGEIDNLIVDPQSGKISHVVVGLGGLMGVGEKKVVVPWSDVKMTAATSDRKPSIVMDQTRLESAPRYERSARADRAPAASPATTKDSDKPATSDRPATKDSDTKK